jgi:hypothetical protein
LGPQGIGRIRDFWPELDWGFCRIFEKAVQRRGVHVSTLKIGSRDGVLCFGGIQRFYAELRREYYGGNLVWVFLRILLVSPRGATEEGGHYVCFMRAFWGNFGELSCGVNGVT